MPSWALGALVMESLCFGIFGICVFRFVERRYAVAAVRFDLI